MLFLRNLAFYPAFYLGSFCVTAASLICLPFSREAFRRRVRDWGSWQRWCLTHLIGCEIRVEGAVSEEPVLYAVKHESFFEAIDAPRLFGCPGVFAKEELFRIPGWGKAALAYGLIPVARDKGAGMLRTMIKGAKALVADGRPLVIFPEGTRVPHGERRELQAGFAGLYKMLGLTVVPVAIDSGPAYHRWIKRPRIITYRFGEPIPPGLPREEVERLVLDRINALND